MYMYVRKKDLCSLPPTEDAFAHHMKQAILQTSIWVKVNQSHPVIPDPFKFGWSSDGRVRPLLTIVTLVPENVAASTNLTAQGTVVINVHVVSLGYMNSCSCGSKPKSCSYTLLAFLDTDNDN